MNLGKAFFKLCTRFRKFAEEAILRFGVRSQSAKGLKEDTDTR